MHLTYQLRTKSESYVDILTTKSLLCVIRLLLRHVWTIFAMPLAQYTQLKISTQKLQFIADVFKSMNIDLRPIFLDDTDAYAQGKMASEKIAVSELVAIYKRIVQYHPSCMSVRLGSRILARHYGLYGCVLMCQNTIKDAIQFAIRYHQMVTRTTDMILLKESDETYQYIAKDVLHVPELKNFNLEFQCAIHLALIRHLADDPDLKPVALNLECEHVSNIEVFEEFFACPIHFNQAMTSLELSAEQMAINLPKRNASVIPILLKTCDDELSQQLMVNDFLLSVYKWVSQNAHRNIASSAMASEMGMTDRTLRRKLASYNTSYSEICREVKSKLAQKYVHETQLSFEDIARSLGYTEIANFRRAFKMWTSQTPSQFRNN